MAKVETNWHGQQVVESLTINASKEMIERLTFQLQRDVIRSISKKGRRGKKVVHSPPGHPPYRQTGNLASSINTEFRDKGLTGIVGTNVEYAIHLEYGTRRMAARPFLRPALYRLRDKIPRSVRKAF